MSETAPLLPVAVEGMAYGGHGIARVDGKVYFVVGGIPGDEGLARVVEDKGRYADALLESVTRPSPLRGPSPCAYSAACGGCQWMGIGYEQQLAWKRSFVEAAFTRIGKLPAAGADGIEILGSPAPTGYRNRVLVRLHVGDDGRVRLGYFRRGTHELVAIDRCAIAEDALNAGLEALRGLDGHGLAGLRARVELQEIPTDDARRLVLTVYPGDGRSPEVEALVERIRALPMVHWAGLVFELSSAPVVPFDVDLGLTFLTIPGQFQQVNLPLNRVLRRMVLEHVARIRPERVLDLFCGAGNLSLPLADGVRYVEGIESNKKAIVCANRAAERNGLRNVNYLAGDAEKHLWKVSKGREAFDLVILDPPRQGMYRGMIPLKNLAPAHVVYVSCDPTTLARDLGALCKKDRYVLERLVALDFFPNTYHVETVAFLRRA